MTERSIAHGSFTVERSFKAAPARIFAAWSDPAIKGKWYGDPEKDSVAQEFDFRPGGRELRAGEISDGTRYNLDIRYYDIVPDERIVYAYEVVINGNRISVSVATVEFRPDAEGTRLLIAEHGAFLDGHENPEERRGGTMFTMIRLAALVETGAV